MTLQEQQHPVLIAIQSLLKPGEAGKIVLADEDAQLLAFGLKKHATDPTLPAAIVALYDIAAHLIDKGSQETALKMLEAIRSVAHELPCLTSVDETASAAAVGAKVAKSAPVIDAPKPKGAISLSSFLDPGMQRPVSPRGKR